MGYAVQGAGAYRLAASLRQAPPAFSRRVLVLRYEDLCARPRETMFTLLSHLDLPREPARETCLEHIAPRTWIRESFTRQLCQTVWHETAPVAREFGYTTADALGG